MKIDSRNCAPDNLTGKFSNFIENVKMCQPVFARAFYLTFHHEGPGNEVGSAVTLTTVQSFDISAC